MTTLHILRETNLLDVPATLRKIADDIEADTFGQPQGCVVVLDADQLHVCYCGSGEAALNAHLLLHAGAGKIIAQVLEQKT